MNNNEITPPVLIEDFSRRLSTLEQNQFSILPLVGKIEQVAETFVTIKDDIKEIKDSVKIIGSEQGDAKVALVNFENRIKVLDEDRQNRVDRKRVIRNVVFGACGTVLAALVVYFLKIK